MGRRREREMEAKRQSHWWWFDSHNSPRCSPWLHSTLAELDEKTKAMLKLIEQDADSFAQRAEMYYKKRPELISMVEDFYRAHRSLAERYDQLRADPSSVRAKSPLRHSFSHFPKGFFENALESVKSLDSFTDEAYNSEESAESEIDDPEQVDYVRVDQDGSEGEKHDFGGASYDELMKLREELERLQEENNIQRAQIKQKDKENEELVTQLRNLREEIDEVKRESAVTLKKQTNDMKKLQGEMGSLMLQNMHHKNEVMKLREESETEKRGLNDALVEKDEEKREVIRQLSLAMEMLREENQALKKSIIKDASKKCSSPEFQIFKGIDLGKLFGFSPKCQTSIVPL